MKIIKPVIEHIYLKFHNVLFGPAFYSFFISPTSYDTTLCQLSEWHLVKPCVADSCNGSMVVWWDAHLGKIGVDVDVFKR